MHQAPRFEHSNKSLVRKLNKAIYSLKQSPRARFQKLAHILSRLGFFASVCDLSLFIKVTPQSTTYVLVYVDDILVSGNSPTFINSLKHNLSRTFALNDLGLLHYFLGIEINYTAKGDIHLSQKKYVLNLLRKAHMENAKPLNTPMTDNLKLTKEGHDLMDNPTLYHSVVGAFQYVTITRP